MGRRSRATGRELIRDSDAAIRMNTLASGFDAVTFDFYNTLAHHRAGQGRGRMLMTYLQEHGLASDPWEHQVLYDVFALHAIEYDPAHPPEAKQRYWTRLADRVFRRLNVRNGEESVAAHAENIWQLLGPNSLAVFPDVLEVLTCLEGAGLGLAVVSNWQCGLENFCVELGLGDVFDHVIASAEIRYSKPEPEIFHEACRRLGVPAHRVLHVGDSPADDLVGGRQAGLSVLLLRREGGNVEAEAGEPSIPDLARLPELLGLGPCGRQHLTLAERRS